MELLLFGLAIFFFLKGNADAPAYTKSDSWLKQDALNHVQGLLGRQLNGSDMQEFNSYFDSNISGWKGEFKSAYDAGVEKRRSQGR